MEQKFVENLNPGRKFLEEVNSGEGVYKGSESNIKKLWRK
jgi:hypothetical protein